MTDIADLAMTKSMVVALDVAALLKARNPLLWIVTREEQRVEGLLARAAKAAEYVARTWDIGAGVLKTNGEPDTAFKDSDNPRGGNFEDPDAVLKLIAQRAGLRGEDERQGERAPGVWILRDLPVWLEGPPSAKTLRLLRNIVRSTPGVHPDDAQQIIVISPSGNVPAELANNATVIEWPLPDRDEIGVMLDRALKKNKLTPMKGNARDAAISSAVGLSGDEAEACFARSIVQESAIVPHVVANEKKRVIARDGLLEWVEPLKGGLDAVGGLSNLIPWIKQRKLAFSAEARAYGLPRPKGIALLGIPGCGKSYTAKATATGFEVPLLKLDMGALKSKFVGESESNLRAALNVVEAIGDCVLWLDEIEKALAGATDGSADGGVSADALGTILNWMQERQSGAFIIATANDPAKLPPELIRKGRFDEVWWVDVPTLTERKQVLKAALRANGLSDLDIDLSKVAAATNKYTGAELAALIPEAMFVAFADNKRQITAEDLLIPTVNFKPLAVTAQVRLDKLRADWKDLVRPASPEEDVVEVELDEDDESGGRVLNLDRPLSL